MNWSDAELWMLAALVLGIAEIFVAGFVLACLAIGALGAAVGAAMDYDLTAQLLLAAFSATIAFVFLRPTALKLLYNRAEIKTGVDALAGREAVVTRAFNAQTGQGRCKIDGDDWAAVLSPSAAPLPDVGQRVRIVRASSNTLEVKSLSA